MWVRIHEKLQNQEDLPTRKPSIWSVLQISFSSVIFNGYKLLLVFDKATLTGPAQSNTNLAQVRDDVPQSSQASAYDDEYDWDAHAAFHGCVCIPWMICLASLCAPVLL